MEIYYNEEGRELNINTNNNLIDKGVYGSVYKLDNDRCIKIFNVFDREVYDIISYIKKLDLKNFYQIYDLIYTKKRKFIGYIMKYYKRENIDILTMPTLYILENLNNIYDSMIKLSSKDILVNDLHCGNVILTKEEIIIVDTDLYRFSKGIDKDKLVELNIVKLRHLIEELFYYSLVIYHNNMQDPLYELDMYDKINHKDGIYTFLNEFKGYKYPIDYIKKRSRR